MLSNDASAVFVDDGTYPIARWAATRAALRRVPVKQFPLHDAGHLERCLTAARGSLRRPIVVTDGLHPRTGRTAPLERYLAMARARGGTVVVDDSQAAGVLGTPGGPTPYGRGGGGTTRQLRLKPDGLIVVSSYAKAFGVPIAALAGDAHIVDEFRREADVRVHCSPPAIPTVLALPRALDHNETRGDRDRGTLWNRVVQFRNGARSVGVRLVPSRWPLQVVRDVSGSTAESWHLALRRRGIHALLLARRHTGQPELAFVIRRDLRPDDIDRAVEELGRIAIPAAS